MRSYYFLLLSVLCLSTRCTTSGSKDNSITGRHTTITLSENSLKNSFPDTSVFKTVQMVKLETNEHSFLKAIERIYRHNDTLFVFDKFLNKIVLFNTNGKYISHIHNIGKGPSEYLSLHDFCLDTINRQIILLCDRPYKLMRFGYNGKIVGEKRMDDFFYNIATDGTNFFCNRSDINNKRPDQYEIAYLDGDFNISDNKLHMRENFKNTLFTRGNFLTSCQSIYYTRRLDNTIYQIKDTELIRKYNIDFAGHSLPESLLNYGVLEFSEACRENEYVYSITDVMESDHHLFFRTNIGLFVFNKTNQTLLGYKSIWTTKIKIGTGTYNPIGCSNNQIAVIINPMVLASIKETASKIPDFDNWEALKLAQEVDEEDNPILYIYELI